jgi:3',5'-cyclic AMP phosphodiesterase CpdA
MSGEKQRAPSGSRPKRASWRRPSLISIALAAVVWVGAATIVGAVVGGTAPRSAGAPYAPRGLPDRIVLSPGADPAREMSVAYRTNPAQSKSEAQLARAIDSPTLDEVAIAVAGSEPPRPIESANGPALYHQVRFDELEPDTVYAYRLKGADGWSEWLQFKTAAAEERPFRFLYLGDVQNGILSDASRVIRQAFGANGGIELVLHAGDLVDQRRMLDHDDEWGEWTAAGGYHYAVVPQLPVAGNHEYDNLLLPDGGERRRLGRYWPLQFALPQNGARSVKETTYFVDYQGVRFIGLDGTAALDLGAMEKQTRWLDRTLANSRARWNVVFFHQPLFSCGRPADTEELKAAWKPIFEKRKVDLVLQGHDHCYSRLTASAGPVSGALEGPVYMVSVAGSKMYGLTDRAETGADRAAEATQLYQIIDVAADRLSVRVHTATGRLYDSFDIERRPDGTNVLRDRQSGLIAQRVCDGGLSPDGTSCGTRTKHASLGR